MHTYTLRDSNRRPIVTLNQESSKKLLTLWLKKNYKIEDGTYAEQRAVFLS